MIASYIAITYAISFAHDCIIYIEAWLRAYILSLSAESLLLIMLRQSDSSITNKYVP